MRRWAKVLIGALAALAVLLVLNAVVLDRQAKPAETTVDGGEILRLPGGDLQVLDSGPVASPTVTTNPGGPAPPAPIVLLHCFTCAIDWWDEMIPLLERGGQRVIAIDLLGHGGSEKPRGGYSIGNQAELVAQALAQLNVEQATVVGHSLGGAVAVALAEQSPKLAGGIVIVDSVPDRSYGSLSLLATAAFAPLIGEALWRMKMDWSIRSGLKEAFAPGYDVPDEFVEDVKRMTYTSYDHSPSAFDSYTSESPLDERLRELDLPLLVMFGAEEQIADDPREALSAYADIPGAETELIAGAGHSPNVEKPAETAGLVLRLAGVAGARATDQEQAAGQQQQEANAEPDRRIVALCQQAIIGPGRANWREQSAVAGSFGLSGPGRNFRNAFRAGDVLITKVFAVLADRTPVVLRVPKAERRRVSLFYGPIRSVRAVDEGAAQVTFEPCRDKPRTAFPGGLALKNRRPITLEVVVGGSVRRLRLG